MKHRYTTLILVFSISFNIAFLIAWGVNRLNTQKTTQDTSASDTQEKQNKKLTPEWEAHYDRLCENLTPVIREIRKNLAVERQSLGLLLHDQNANSSQIAAQLQRIGELQLDIERRIVFFVLEERDLFSPAESKRYMDKVVKRIVDGGHTSKRNKQNAEASKIDRQEFP